MNEKAVKSLIIFCMHLLMLDIISCLFKDSDLFDVKIMMISNLNFKIIMNYMIAKNNYSHSCSSTLYLFLSTWRKPCLAKRMSKIQKSKYLSKVLVCRYVYCPMKWNMVQIYFTDLNGLRIPQSTTTDEWMAWVLNEKN